MILTIAALALGHDYSATDDSAAARAPVVTPEQATSVADIDYRLPPPAGAPLVATTVNPLHYRAVDNEHEQLSFALGPPSRRRPLIGLRYRLAWGD